MDALGKLTFPSVNAVGVKYIVTVLKKSEVVEVFRNVHTHSGHSKGRVKCWSKIQEKYYTGKISFIV